MNITQKQKRADRVIALVKSGRSVLSVAEELGVSKQAVYQLLQRRGYTRDSLASQGPKSGRK